MSCHLDKYNIYKLKRDEELNARRIKIKEKIISNRKNKDIGDTKFSSNIRTESKLNPKIRNEYIKKLTNKKLVKNIQIASLKESTIKPLITSNVTNTRPLITNSNNSNANAINNSNANVIKKPAIKSNTLPLKSIDQNLCMPSHGKIKNQLLVKDRNLIPGLIEKSIVNSKSKTSQVLQTKSTGGQLVKPNLTVKKVDSNLGRFNKVNPTVNKFHKVNCSVNRLNKINSTVQCHKKVSSNVDRPIKVNSTQLKKVVSTVYPHKKVSSIANRLNKVIPTANQRKNVTSTVNGLKKVCSNIDHTNKISSNVNGLKKVSSTIDQTKKISSSVIGLKKVSSTVIRPKTFSLTVDRLKKSKPTLWRTPGYLSPCTKKANLKRWMTIHGHHNYKHAACFGLAASDVQSSLKCRKTTFAAPHVVETNPNAELLTPTMPIAFKRISCRSTGRRTMHGIEHENMFKSSKIVWSCLRSRDTKSYVITPVWRSTRKIDRQPLKHVNLIVENLDDVPVETKRKSVVKMNKLLDMGEEIKVPEKKHLQFI